MRLLLALLLSSCSLSVETEHVVDRLDGVYGCEWVRKETWSPKLVSECTLYVPDDTEHVAIAPTGADPCLAGGYVGTHVYPTALTVDVFMPARDVLAPLPRIAVWPVACQ